MTRIVTDQKTWEDGTQARAVFDESRRLRYRLEREFLPSAFDPFLFAERKELAGTVTFAMLNPSIADAMVNDRTVARCCAFAKRWGYKRLIVVNLFALRSTDPKGLLSDPDPIGEENDNFIVEAARESALVIAGWGVHGTLNRRNLHVLQLLTNHHIPVHCLGHTKGNHPRHPLYTKGDTEPTFF